MTPRRVLGRNLAPLSHRAHLGDAEIEPPRHLPHVQPDKLTRGRQFRRSHEPARTDFRGGDTAVLTHPTRVDVRYSQPRADLPDSEQRVGIAVGVSHGQLSLLSSAAITASGLTVKPALSKLVCVGTSAALFNVDARILEKSSVACNPIHPARPAEQTDRATRHTAPSITKGMNLISYTVHLPARDHPARRVIHDVQNPLWIWRPINPHARLP